MKNLPLNHDSDLTKVVLDDGDYACLSRGRLARLAFEIFLIRRFEETLLQLSSADCIHGPVHTSIGHEACAAGAIAALRPSDKIASTHRAHHHYLSKAVTWHIRDGVDILEDDVPAPLQEEVTHLMGEIMGLAIGCCGGRGGSMHLRNEAIGVIGTNAIVAGGVPLATGAAFAAQRNQSEDIVVCFLGDGAVNQGSFHEALNLAGIWKLPIIYLVENNLYAVGTAIHNTTATTDLAVKADGYGIGGMVVYGMDPLAVNRAVDLAAQTARSGQGATLIEAKCYRFHHHAGPVAGSSFGYRSREEEADWVCFDPYEMFPQKLLELDLLTRDQFAALKQKAEHLVTTALQSCTVKRNGTLTVNDKLWPDPAGMSEGLRSNGQEWEEIAFQERNDFAEFEERSYVDAIAAVTGRWLEKDSRTFVMGEEIANFGGGPYGATKGLPAQYPDRILNTPISECGFVGLAGGAAMSNMRPIVEIMFPDFALVAADQLFNQIGKLRHMYGDSTDMPLVVRTRVAIGCGYGGQHSMDPAGLFSLFSGWTVVAPSTAFDYVGLFNSAMTSLNPVLMIEHHELYSENDQVPANNLDYHVALGRARVISEGRDVTLLSYSRMLRECQRVADELTKQGISVELIDLRTISPTDIDYDTIGRSLRKTNSLVIVEQAPKSLSIGATIVEHCQAAFFDYLDGPIITLNSLDIPNPVSRPLEQAATPSRERIRETLVQAAKRQY